MTDEAKMPTGNFCEVLALLDLSERLRRLHLLGEAFGDVRLSIDAHRRLSRKNGPINKETGNV